MFRGKMGSLECYSLIQKKAKKKLICKFFVFLNKCGVSGIWLSQLGLMPPGLDPI